MSERYICIHGHFYQPPRENPWLGAVERQDSAAPYHDWNERITDECYAPNAASRILDPDGRIVQIVNNYARISFNVGPTLMAWLEAHAPATFARILDADWESRRRFSGHGSALAQPYNHMILPLANSRDRRTQVRWGIADFTHRFGRDPEGMWLPETAVDLATLEVLAEAGIRFTILAPHQAARVRPLVDGSDSRDGSQPHDGSDGGNGNAWQDVRGGRIDTTRAYRCSLPSGRTIAIFFYDGPIARDVAFGRLLASGEAFAGRLVGAFAAAQSGPALVHIATDGETYGHHHRFGDMALAYALHHIESNGLAHLTNYGEHLERVPPTHEVEIVEATSWSCPHGVERWKADCGCSTGAHRDWHQRWRAPLREACDWLRDTLASRFEEAARGLLGDPWAARDGYIDVILDRSENQLHAYVARHAREELTAEDRTRALRLLELQRHAMLMYTSDGWYFDDVSGIETVQVLAHAGRVIHLARELFGMDTVGHLASEDAAVKGSTFADALEAGFLKRLEGAESNLPGHGNAARIYEAQVRPTIVGREQLAAHYAISSLFTTYPERTRVYCFDVERLDYQLREAGRARVAVGRARVTSTITRAADELSFAVLHFGDHNINGGVRVFQGEAAYQAMLAEITAAFSRTDFPELIRAMDRHFGTSTYSLRSLFRDEQHLVLEQILDAQLAEVEAAHQQLYERHDPLMHYLADVGVPPPRVLTAVAESVLNSQLRRALAAETLDPDRVRSLLSQIREHAVPLTTEPLEFVFRRNIEHLAEAVREEPDDPERLARFAAAVELAREMPFTVNFWRVQNTYYELLQTFYPMMRRRAGSGDLAAREWADRFAAVGRRLSVRVD